MVVLSNDQGKAQTAFCGCWSGMLPSLQLLAYTHTKNDLTLNDGSLLLRKSAGLTIYLIFTLKEIRKIKNESIMISYYLYTPKSIWQIKDDSPLKFSH